ncbi:MAG: TonB-dependent receptor, partial [Kangiellaceae bacterium]|nr:TonB-dependent receptor [Kangiellaceae bacterium]
MLKLSIEKLFKSLVSVILAGLSGHSLAADQLAEHNDTVSNNPLAKAQVGDQSSERTNEQENLESNREGSQSDRSATVLNDDSDQDNRIVVTALRNENSQDQTAASISVLDSKQISHLAPTHSNELSWQVPNFWINRGNGQEQLVSLRSPVFSGTGACSEILMLENSVPLRGRGFCNVNQLFEANMLQADRVEVMRGSNSALYGSDAIHGVINVISPNGVGVDSVGLTAGPYNYQRLTTDNSFADEHRLQTQFSREEGFKDDSGFGMQKVTYLNFYQGDSVDVKTTVNVFNLNQETAGYLQQGENAYLNRDLQTINEFPEAYRDAQSVRVQSIVSGLDSNNNQWSVTPYLRHNRMEFLMHFLPGQPTENNGHDSVGINAQLSGLLDNSEQIRWQVGIDSEYTDGFIQQAQSAPTNTGSAFLNAVLPQGQHYNFDVTADSLAFFYNLSSSRSDRAFNWSAGMRIDYLNYDYNNYLLDGNTRDDGTSCGFGGCRYTRPNDQTNSFTEHAGFLSLTYQLSDNIFSYVKYDRAHRMPQVSELYRLQNGQITPTAIPEVAYSNELGLRYSDQGILVDIALFNMQKSNVIFLSADRQWLSGARTSHRGVELSYGVPLFDKLSIAGNYSYSDHRYRNNPQLQGSSNDLDNNIMDSAPKHLSSHQLSYTLDDLLLSLEWIYVGDYFLNPDNTAKYSGHELVNLRADWNASEQTSIS